MHRFMGAINRITRCLYTYRAQRGNTDVSPAQHSQVLAVCRHPGCSQEELSAHLCLDKSTVTRSLTQLEERGYVTRTPNPADKRQLLVEPTQKMRDLFPAVCDIMNQWYARLTVGISEEEFAVFHSVLRRIEANARNAVADSEEGDPV